MLPCYTTTTDPSSKRITEQQGNTSQVNESCLNYCNFRDAHIAAVIGLFPGISFFTQQTVSLLLPFVYQVDPYIVN